MLAGHRGRHPAPATAPRCTAVRRIPVNQRCSSASSWPSQRQPACGSRTSASASPLCARPAAICPASPHIDGNPCRREVFRQAARSSRQRRGTAAPAAAVAAGAATAAQQAAQSSLATLLISVGIFVLTCAVAVFLICAIPTLIVRSDMPPPRLKGDSFLIPSSRDLTLTTAGMHRCVAEGLAVLD